MNLPCINVRARQRVGWSSRVLHTPFLEDSQATLGHMGGIFSPQTRRCHVRNWTTPCAVADLHIICKGCLRIFLALWLFCFIVISHGMNYQWIRRRDAEFPKTIESRVKKIRVSTIFTMQLFQCKFSFHRFFKVIHGEENYNVFSRNKEMETIEREREREDILTSCKIKSSSDIKESCFTSEAIK